MTNLLEKRIEVLEQKLESQSALIDKLLEHSWAVNVLQYADPDEERFPGTVAKALVSGENPIKVFRTHRGMTQAELADACDTSRLYISQLETQDRKPGLKLASSIAKALRVDIENLV